MGRELTTTIKCGREKATANVLLESSEIISRGGLKRKFAFSAMKTLAVDGGWLKFSCDGEQVAIQLDDAADAWLKRITNPPSRVAKLRVKPGDCVHLAGEVEAGVAEELAAAGAKLAAKLSGAPNVVLLFIESLDGLKKLAAIEKHLAADGAVWVLWPKGPEAAVKHEDVVSAGKRIGMNQTISMGFSARFTGLRLVRGRKK